jgi:hypothetical protein
MVRDDSRWTAAMQEFRFTTNEFEPAGQVDICQECGEVFDLSSEGGCEQECPNCRRNTA